MSGYNHYSHPYQVEKQFGSTSCTTNSMQFPVTSNNQTISPAQIELQRANQHIYELQREKDTLKVLLAKYQTKQQIKSPISQGTQLLNFHQRLGSQGTLTTTAGTRSLATEYNSQVSGRKRRNSQELQNVGGSRERLKHEMIKVKEGMQHLLKAVDNRCDEVDGIKSFKSNKDTWSQEHNKNDQHIQRQRQYESCKVSKRTSQHQYDNPTKDHQRNINSYSYYPTRDNNGYYLSSESDIIQTTSSISSYKEEDTNLQTQNIFDNPSDLESISDNITNYLIPSNKNSKIPYNNGDIITGPMDRNKQPNSQLIVEAQQLLNLIKQNDQAFQSFLKMFGSEQDFFNYLNQPSNDNTTALMKIMGLLQELLSNQIKSYTSSSEQNFTTIPIMTQHSLPSQWSSVIPTQTTQGVVFPTFRRPTSPSHFSFPQITLETQGNCNNLIAMNGLQQQQQQQQQYFDNNNKNNQKPEFFQIDKGYSQANYENIVSQQENISQSRSKYDYQQYSPAQLSELPLHEDIPQQRAQSQGNPLNFKKQQMQTQQPLGQYSQYPKARLPTFHEQSSPSGGYFQQNNTNIDGSNQQVVFNTQPDIQQQFNNLLFVTSPVVSSQKFQTPNQSTAKHSVNYQNNPNSNNPQNYQQTNSIAQNQQQQYLIPNQFKGQFNSQNNSQITNKSQNNQSINTTSPYISNVQDQYYQINPSNYQLNRRNQSEQDLRHNRQARLQLQETSQYFDTQHRHASSSSMIYNPNNHTNNQLSSLNQSYASQGYSNPPVSVKQLVQGFDGINNGNERVTKNNINTTEIVRKDIQDKQLNNSSNTQITPQSLNSISSNTATLQYNSSQNLNNTEGIKQRGSPVKQTLKNNNNQGFQSNENSILTNTASDNYYQLGGATGRSGYLDQFNRNSNENNQVNNHGQFASMDSSAVQSALQTINQFLNQPNNGKQQQQFIDQLGGQNDGGQLKQQIVINQGNDMNQSNYGDIESGNTKQGVLSGLQSRNNSDAFDQDIGFNSRMNQSYQNVSNNNNTSRFNNDVTPDKSGYCLTQSNAFYQLPISGSSMGQSRMGRSIDKNSNKVSPIQSRIGSVQDLQRFGFNEYKINASLLTGRSLGNSRAGSALRLERSGLLTDRILDCPRRIGDLSSERTREVAGELRELKQREAVLKMQDFGGEIAGLEDKLQSLRKRVQDENRKKEELNREKIVGQQEEKERRKQQKEDEEKRKRELIEKEKRDKLIVQERKRQRDDQEYNRKLQEIKAEEERISREKEEEIKRRMEYEEEDRKRKIELQEFERKIAEEKQAYLLKRKLEKEELERKSKQEEMQMLERKKQMEIELEKVRVAEEQERKRRIQLETEERRKRQRLLEEETTRKLQEFEKEQRERIEREEKERQLRLEEEEQIERKRQEDIERKRQEILQQIEQERLKKKQLEDGDTNYMKVTEARVSYVRSVQKEYLRRSNSSMIEAAQCSPTKKSLQPISASINPNWQKVLSKFTNGELEDINDQQIENKNSNNNMSMSQENGSNSGLNGSIVKVRTSGVQRNGSVSPSGKRNINKDNSPTTPKSFNKNNSNNNILSPCGSPMNRGKEGASFVVVEGVERKENVIGQEEKKNGIIFGQDEYNANQQPQIQQQQQQQLFQNNSNQTFENVVNDIASERNRNNQQSSKGVLLKLKPQQVIITDTVFDAITEEDRDSNYLSNSNGKQLDQEHKYQQYQQNNQLNMIDQVLSETKEQLNINDSLEKDSNYIQLQEIDNQQLSAVPIIPFNDRPSSKDSSNSQQNQQQSQRIKVANRPPSIQTASQTALPKSNTPLKQQQQQQQQLTRCASLAEQKNNQDTRKINLNVKTADKISSDNTNTKLEILPKKSNNNNIPQSRKQSPMISSCCTPTLTKQSLSSETTSKGKEGSVNRIQISDSPKKNTDENKMKSALVRKKNKSKSVVVAFGATLPIKSALKTSFASVIATVMDKGVHYPAFKESTSQIETKQE